jgi:hypothetical protein
MTSPNKARKGEHPEHWYVEDHSCVQSLVDFLRPELRGGWFLEQTAIWDPCCGGGNIPATFTANGFKAFGTDIVDRKAAAFLGTFDFLQMRAVPVTWARSTPVAIVMNPPYKDLEAFVRKALTLSDRFVAALVPLTFLGSTTRGLGLFSEHPPRFVATLSKRPTMPPGDKVAELGGKAFKGGKICYCWMIWDLAKPGAKTQHVWLVPPAGDQ